MNRSASTYLIAFVRFGCVLSLVALSGCTALGERVAGWYVTRELDKYLDFTSEQKHAARARVDETIVELRRGELQHWVSFLREVRLGFQAGVSEDDVARLQRHYDARLDAGVALLAPQLSAMLTDLSPEQVDHLTHHLREEVDDHFEERDLPEPKRHAAIEKRALKALEDLVGDLSDEQEAAVRQVIRSLPDERPAQYRSAMEHVQRFHDFMAQKPNAAQIELELRSMWEHRYDALGPGSNDKATRRTWQRKALLQVLQLLDAEQRAHASEELTERIRLLKRFMISG